MFECFLLFGDQLEQAFLNGVAYHVRRPPCRLLLDQLLGKRDQIRVVVYIFQIRLFGAEPRRRSEATTDDATVARLEDDHLFTRPDDELRDAYALSVTAKAS